MSWGSRGFWHRLRLRELGYRPVQHRAPDVRSGGFADAAARHAAKVARAEIASEGQEFVDAVSSGWEE